MPSSSSKEAYNESTIINFSASYDETMKQKNPCFITNCVKSWQSALTKNLNLSFRKMHYTRDPTRLENWGGGGGGTLIVKINLGAI